MVLCSRGLLCPTDRRISESLKGTVLRWDPFKNPRLGVAEVVGNITIYIKHLPALHILACQNPIHIYTTRYFGHPSLVEFLCSA